MLPIAERTLQALGISLPAHADARPDSSAAQALAQLTTVWQRQLNATIYHGTESVDALTKNFAGIERQLSQALELTQQAAMRLKGDGAMSGAVASANARLNDVMAMIQDAV